MSHDHERVHRQKIECECGQTFNSQRAFDAHQKRERRSVKKVYDEVYREMYRLVRDIRLVKEQMHHEGETMGGYSPRQFVLQEINRNRSRELEWKSEDVRGIAIELITTTVHQFDNVEEDLWPDSEIEGHPREDELRAIIEDVEDDDEDDNPRAGGHPCEAA